MLFLKRLWQVFIALAAIVALYPHQIGKLFFALLLLSAITVMISGVVASARIMNHYNLDRYEASSSVFFYKTIWAYLRRKKTPTEEQMTFPDCVPQMVSAFRRFLVTGLMIPILFLVNVVSCALYSALSVA